MLVTSSRRGRRRRRLLATPMRIRRAHHRLGVARTCVAARLGRYHAGMPNHVVVSTLGWSKAALEDAYAAIAGLDFGQADLAVHEGWAHLNPSALADGGAAAG